MAESNVHAMILHSKPNLVHPLFNNPQSDIIFQSYDGVNFHVQRKFLEVGAGAFPGAEFETNGEITHLTESAAVLEVLFGFIHPKRYPDVEELEFILLAEVAEAAEKYEAFAAMELCRLQMRSFLPKHATEILKHATRHDCVKLMQHAIPYLVRQPLAKIADMLPVRYILPWIRYHQAFENIFASALTSILSLKIASPSTGSRPGAHFTQSLQPQVCHACLLVMINNIEELKAFESVEEFEKSLEKQRTRTKGCISTACQYIAAFESLCTEMKEKAKEVTFQL